MAVPVVVTEQQAQQQQRVQQQVKPLKRDFSLWTLATGIIYGLQPDALFVIIPALALPTPLAAVAYMSMFVVGTVTAMGSYTAFIGAGGLPSLCVCVCARVRVRACGVHARVCGADVGAGACVHVCAHACVLDVILLLECPPVCAWAGIYGLRDGWCRCHLKGA